MPAVSTDFVRRLRRGNTLHLPFDAKNATIIVCMSLRNSALQVWIRYKVRSVENDIESNSSEYPGRVKGDHKD